MTPLGIAILTSSCGLAGVCLGHHLNLRREKRQAIREFRRKLGILRSGFERQPEDHLFELYHNSVPKIQGDVAAMKSDLRCGYPKLRGAADAFAGIKRHEIEKPVADGLGTEFETGRQRILEAIDALERAL